jgi:AAA ATPase domain
MREVVMAVGTSCRIQGTLPSPTSGFVGREAELSRVRELLRRSRLVTVTGAGGVGKTRLALRAAAIVLATSFFAYWRISGLLREAEYWLDQALGRCPQRSVVRARVLAARGYVWVVLGDFANGRADAEAAVAMAATFSDLATAGRGHSALHRALAFAGNVPEAQAAAQAAAEALTASDDTLGGRWRPRTGSAT